MIILGGFLGICILLSVILLELREIHRAVAPKWDINFSPTLNLSREQKQAMALAAIKVMKDYDRKAAS